MRIGSASEMERDAPERSKSGRHHPDVVGQGAGDALHGGQAGGMDAVVVGDEDTVLQGLASRFDCPPPGSNCPGGLCDSLPNHSGPTSRAILGAP